MGSFTPEEVEQLRARVLELEERARERERLEAALDEGRRIGAASYLRKPFDIDDLIQVVEQALERHQEK